MPATHSDVVRDGVQFRYVVKGDSPETISTAYDGSPSASTIRRWIEAEKWDEMRDLRSGSGRSIAASLRKMLNRKLATLEDGEQMATSAEMDAIHKGWKIISDLDQESVRAQNAMDIIDELGTYVADNHPELIATVNPVLIEFSNRLVARAK